MRSSFFLVILSVLSTNCYPTKTAQPLPRPECRSYEDPSCSACLRGDTSSCLSLIDAYQNGEKLVRDLARASYFWRYASPLLETSCTKKDANACEKLGQTLWRGMLTQRDIQNSARYFFAAESHYQARCNKKELTACLSLGALYSQKEYYQPRRALTVYEQLLQEGEGAATEFIKYVWVDTYKTEREFLWPTWLNQSPQLEALCREGDGSVCDEVGSFYLFLDPTLAQELVSLGCTRDNGRACFLLSEMKPQEMTPLREKSCDLGYIDGCKAIAALGGVSADKYRARWRENCMRGSLPDCSLSLTLQKDDAVEERSTALHREDCSYGQGRSCMRWLASERKKGLAPTVKPIVELRLKEGCQDGIAEDCLALTSILFPKEKESARQTMERSCQLGSMDACKQLSSLIWWGVNSVENETKASYYACLAEQLHPFQTTSKTCQTPN